jgi:NAD(P)H-hydrate epimerase
LLSHLYNYTYKPNNVILKNVLGGVLRKNLIKICSVDEMRKIDEEASKRYGIDHMLLMEDAGSSVYNVVLREIGLDKRFCVLAGTGNNGGDAIVAGRRLYASGSYVEIYVIGDLSKATDLMRRNYETASKIGIPIYHIVNDDDLDKNIGRLSQCEVFISGIIGIGLRGEVTGFRRRLIEYINSLRKIVVSVDIPSGVGGDNGKIYGAAIKSSYTVTFGMPKYGNILYPGYYYNGKLFISRLSYPPQLLDSEEIKTFLNHPMKPPERIRWGHKGVFGKFLVIGGARYYYGAPYYASYSFLKAGGGYSRLAAPKSIIPYIASRNSEIVFIPMEETEEGSISKINYKKILEIIDEYDIDIVAIGSGASLNNETQELIRELVPIIERPLIIDGDGITAIAGRTDLVKERRSPTIITPHLGEFSRLTGLKIDQISENPVEILRKTVFEWRSIIVLKGAHTLIGCPDGKIFVNMTGNPGMAKAGTGDVLVGSIAAMYGIGFRNIEDATRMGVLIHGLAGDLAADELGEDGVTPDEIINYLPKAVKILREDPDYIEKRYMPEII